MGLLEMMQQDSAWLEDVIEGRIDPDAARVSLAEQAFNGEIVSTGNISGWRVA